MKYIFFAFLMFPCIIGAMSMLYGFIHGIWNAGRGNPMYGECEHHYNGVCRTVVSDKGEHIIHS